jgi:hypothetical protein
MSHNRYKIKFERPGSYGSTDTEYMYVDNNVGADCITFYDNYGDVMFSIEEWGKKDMRNQLLILLTHFHAEDHEELEYWNTEDSKKIEDRNK